jgi:rubrerythrin
MTMGLLGMTTKDEYQKKYQREYTKRNRKRLSEYAKQHRAKNRKRYNQIARLWREQNREKINARRSQTRLIAGIITPAEYDALLSVQKGVCAICKTTQSIQPSPGHKRRRMLHVDHDHQTRIVRGLLCHHCNAGLGHFKDRKDLLQAAIDYL